MQKVTVLVIDDDSEICSLFISFFGNKKTEIRTYSHVPQFIDIEKCMPNLILLDCWIDGVLSGPELVKKIKSSKKLNCTQVALTSSDMQMKQVAEKVKADHWLPKPLHWEDVETIISHLN